MGLDRSALRWGEYDVNWDSPQAGGFGYYLAGWWPEIKFDLVGGKIGTISSAPRRTPLAGGGVGIRFDGTDDFVTFGAMRFTNPLSVFCWVRPADVTATDRRIIGAASGTTSGFIRQNATNLQALNTAGSTWNTIVGGLTTDWQHIGATYLSDNSCTGYRNGVVGSNVASTQPNFIQSQNWTFGSRYGGFGTYYDGLAYDLRMYRGVVPASVIRAMYDHDTRDELKEPHGRRTWFVPSAGGSPWYYRLQESLAAG